MIRGAETEIKLGVPNLSAMRRKILALGFKRVEARHFERNTLFDFADERLRNARCLLRLREASRRWVLTFKGAPAESRHYKTRQEIEVIIEDGERCRAIFEGLGMREAFHYEKFRTVFSPNPTAHGARGALLVLDETPVGSFVELEGPEAWIDRTAARLGYRREDYITASYAALYRQYCEARGEPPQNLVFKSH